MAKGISQTAPVEEKSELVEKLSTPVSQQEREEMKKELLKELMGDRNIVEVHFKKSVVAESERFAEILNARPKVVDTWEVEDGNEEWIY